MQRDVQPLGPPYPVNETFESLQGEAQYTGTPAVFIRMQGCPVGCPWCDTKHTWDINSDREVSVDVMGAKTEVPVDTFAWCDVATLARIVGAADIEHVVITGGEPCQYDLRPLIETLEAAGHRVQVETSGTYRPFITRHTFLTVSPKYSMPGGRPVLAEALLRADEFKYPVGRQTDIETVLDYLQPIHLERNTPIWLQPLSLSTRATGICIEAAHRFDWRVSLQTHKFISIR
jgi:7-carboxy-7-deazaguanine synthase